MNGFLSSISCAGALIGFRMNPRKTACQQPSRSIAGLLFGENMAPCPSRESSRNHKLPLACESFFDAFAAGSSFPTVPFDSARCRTPCRSSRAWPARIAACALRGCLLPGCAAAPCFIGLPAPFGCRMTSARSVDHASRDGLCDAFVTLCPYDTEQVHVTKRGIRSYEAFSFLLPSVRMHSCNAGFLRSSSAGGTRRRARRHARLSPERGTALLRPDGQPV